MNKNKPTVLQGYIEGAPHIIQFMKKEIGSNETYIKEMTKVRDEYKKIAPEGTTLNPEDKRAKKLEARMKAIKAAHHELYSTMRAHGKSMRKLFDDKTIIDEHQLNTLIRHSHKLSESNVFMKKELEWSSEAGTNAMKKFTALVFQNDLKKYQYYHTCMKNNSFKGMNLEEILDRPLPKLREPKKNDREDLARKMQEFSERLKKTDSLLHVDSSEIKEMKAAMKSVTEALTNNVPDAELGSRLEALQAATMKYVKAKGVGMQSTQRGKDRMDISLDMCKMAAEYMDCYASDERVKNVKNFEKNMLGTELSKNGIFDYRIDLNSVTVEAMSIDGNGNNGNKKTNNTKEAKQKQISTPEIEKETSKPKQQEVVKETPKAEIKKEVKENLQNTSSPKPENGNKVNDQERETDKLERLQQERFREHRVEFGKFGRSVNYLGDPDGLQKIYDEHPEYDDEQKEHLQKRIASNRKIQNLEKNRNLDQKKRPPCRKYDDGTIMLDIKEMPKQTTANGCWSATLSHMLGHFGVDLTQQDIRAYRPEFRDLKSKDAKKMVDRLSRDNRNEIYDVVDLIHRTVPNVAFNHMLVNVTGNKTVNFFKEKITDILVNKNSPVALLAGGHYVSVVGIKNNNLILQDPDPKKPGGCREVPVEVMYARCKDSSSFGNIVIDWLEDLTFTKDGKCQNNMKGFEKDGFGCNDGVFNPNVEDTLVNHVKGYEFTDWDSFDNGADHKVYIPKMAFEKEMGLEFDYPIENNDLQDANEKEDDLTLDESQNNSPENVAEEKEEVKLTKLQILNDANELAKDSQLFEFMKACKFVLGNKRYTMGCYAEWDEALKKQIPMDILVNDLDLGYSEEELLSLSAKDLYNELENKIDFDLYFDALDIKQQNETVLEDDENELGGM